MKTKPIIIGLVACGLATLVYVHAQPVNSSGKLERAAGLLENGQIKEARAVLGTVDRQDADYATAKGLDALCLHRQDKRKFLDALESGKIQSLDMPAELREELDYRQIETLLVCRKFEALLPKTGEFTERHANSAKAGAITEYRLAALYERGMKNLADATFTQNSKRKKDEGKAAQRIQAGQENLERFLQLAAEGDQNGYQTLTNRNMSVEVAKAMAALGGEDMTVMNMAEATQKEAMALALVQLHNKIDVDAAHENIARMAKFLNQFPNSKHRKRVEIDMASVAVGEGERLTSKLKRAEAAPYLDLARSLFSGVVEDKESSIGRADVLETREGMLRIFYAQKDWANLSKCTGQMIADSGPGEKEWLLAKVYEGAGLSRQQKISRAASVLDELLAIGFRGNPSHDGFIIAAAKWRINVAKLADDEASARRVALLVQNSVCYDSVKRTFLKQFCGQFVQSNTISK